MKEKNTNKKEQRKRRFRTAVVSVYFFTVFLHGLKNITIFASEILNTITNGKNLYFFISYD